MKSELIRRWLHIAVAKRGAKTLDEAKEIAASAFDDKYGKQTRQMIKDYEPDEEELKYIFGPLDTSLKLDEEGSKKSMEWAKKRQQKREVKAKPQAEPTPKVEQEKPQPEFLKRLIPFLDEEPSKTTLKTATGAPPVPPPPSPPTALGFLDPPFDRGWRLPMRRGENLPVKAPDKRLEKVKPPLEGEVLEPEKRHTSGFLEGPIIDTEVVKEKPELRGAQGFLPPGKKQLPPGKVNPEETVAQAAAKSEKGNIFPTLGSILFGGTALGLLSGDTQTEGGGPTPPLRREGGEEGGGGEEKRSAGQKVTTPVTQTEEKKEEELRPTLPTPPKQAKGYTPHLVDTKELKSKIDTLSEIAKQGMNFELPQEAKKKFEEGYEKLNEEIASIKNLYEESLKKIDNEKQLREQSVRNAALLDGVVKGLALMAAGFYGLKKDLNVGEHLKDQLKPADWERSFDRILTDIRDKRQAAMDRLKLEMSEVREKREDLSRREREALENERFKAAKNFDATVQMLEQANNMMNAALRQNADAINEARRQATAAANEFELAKYRTEAAMEQTAFEQKGREKLKTMDIEHEKLKEAKKEKQKKEEKLSKQMGKLATEFDTAIGRLSSGEADKKEFDTIIGKVSAYLLAKGYTPDDISKTIGEAESIWRSKGEEHSIMAQKFKELANKPKIVYMRRPDGKIGPVSVSDVKAALERGYTIVEEERE